MASYVFESILRMLKEMKLIIFSFLVMLCNNNFSLVSRKAEYYYAGLPVKCDTVLIITKSAVSLIGGAV